MEVRDYSVLLGRMKQYGVTQNLLAKSVGIGESTMNLALNSKREFRQDEILKICDVLEIPTREIAAYFFAPKLLKVEDTA